MMLRPTTLRFLSPSCCIKRPQYPRFAFFIHAKSCCLSPGPFFQVTAGTPQSLARKLSTQPPWKQPIMPPGKSPLRENIYTLPNLLTVSRILTCPVLGWSILNCDFKLATALLAYASVTDFADGFIARRYKMQSVVGTILDPAADKTLMTTLTVTLAMQGMLPVSLAAIILGRDVLLSLSAFYIRYTSLPEPKTFMRYWDFSIPSAEVRPTGISKINTALQLTLMGTTTVSPLLGVDISVPLQGLQWTVAITTIWSGLSYLFSKDAVRIVSEKRQTKSRSSS